MTTTEIHKLNELTAIKVYEDGEVILKESSSADCFYIVKKGQVIISKNDISLATLEAGMHFGLMALFDGNSRSADAIAQGNTTLSVIPYNSIKNPENRGLYQKILTNQLTKQQNQLRLMNDLTVSEVNKKISEQTRVESVTAQSQHYEALLKEIHHRVKNNLQTVSSLLFLQSKSITDLDAKKAILSSQQRVESIALIHKNLYQRENLADLEMKSYITQLSHSLIDAYQQDNQDIKVTINMKKLELNVEMAIPIGLIINELITNSLKYAFINKKIGTITISMLRKKNGKIVINLSDNGIGKNEEINDGFGIQLIKLLTRQVEGTFEEVKCDGYGCELVF